METDSTPSDPWQPVASEDGLPAKVPRNEETTPLLEEEEEGTEPKVVVMEWHMCVICLEEMVDSDLLTHTTCGATICAVCLEASRRHSGNEETAHMPCPVSTIYNDHWYISVCVCVCVGVSSYGVLSGWVCAISYS